MLACLLTCVLVNKQFINYSLVFLYFHASMDLDPDDLILMYRETQGKSSSKQIYMRIHNYNLFLQLIMRIFFNILVSMGNCILLIVGILYLYCAVCNLVIVVLILIPPNDSGSLMIQ